MSIVPVLFYTVLQCIVATINMQHFNISQAELRLGKVKLDQLPIDLSNTYASGLEDPRKFTLTDEMGGEGVRPGCQDLRKDTSGRINIAMMGYTVYIFSNPRGSSVIYVVLVWVSEIQCK